MDKLGYTPKLKGYMTLIEQLGLESYINDRLNDGGFLLDAKDKFGLPYASSSEVAGLWNTNFKGKIEGLNVVGFSLTENHTPIMILKDDEQKEYYYEF